MSCSSIHAGGSNAERSADRDKWQRELARDGSIVPTPKQQEFGLALKPTITADQLVQSTEDARLSIEIQIAIRGLAEDMATVEDPSRDFQRDATTIRHAFINADYSMLEAMQFLHANLVAGGRKFTSRRDIAVIKACLPDEYEALDEVKAIFGRLAQASPANILSFPRPKARTTINSVEVDEDDPDRRDPKFIAELARDAEYHFDCWADLVEAQSVVPNCGLLEEVCDVGLDGFAHMMFNLGENPYARESEDGDDEEEEEEEDSRESEEGDEEEEEEDSRESEEG